jgi:hypothetical protein
MNGMPTMGKILSKDTLPYIFYAIGSLCFLIGTLMVIVEKLKQQA